MSKPLQTPVPTSSIARLLDSSAAQRAVATEPVPRSAREGRAEDSTEDNDEPSRRGHTIRRRPVPIKREIVLSSDADETFTRLIDALRRASGTRLTASHAFRSLMRTLEPALPRLEATARVALSLPSNARGYEEERTRFEEALAGVLTNALGPRRG